MTEPIPEENQEYRRKLHLVTDFDFEAVDAPECVALDQMTVLRDTMFPALDVTIEHARLALAWGATQGVGPAEPVLEVAAVWVGGCLQGKDVPLRAGVFVREFAPHARQAHSLRRLAIYHGATRQTVSRLSYGLRASLGLSGVGRYGAGGRRPQGPVVEPRPKGIY